MDGLRRRVLAMTDTAAVVRILGQALRAKGLIGRGRRWHADFEEVRWIVELDKVPHGHRLGIDVGLWTPTLGGNPPTRPTDCPALVHAENMPLGPNVERSAIVRALDLTSNLDDDDRARALEQIADALARYVTSHGTLVAVREAYRKEDLASAFIHKDARGVLNRN